MQEASAKRVGIFLLWKSVRHWHTMDCVMMDMLSLFFIGVGATMRYSMCTRSHQNGADWLEGVDCIMALIVLACSCRNNLFLLFLRHWGQVERNCGGSWVKFELMNSSVLVLLSGV